MPEELPAHDSQTTPVLTEIRDTWSALSPTSRHESFRRLPWPSAEEFFLGLEAHDHIEILRGLPVSEQKLWIRLLAPDDAADVLQEASLEERDGLLALLSKPAQEEVTALLTYAEDEAGGLMSPRFARVRRDMTRNEALNSLRQLGRDQLETPYYVYVLDRQQRLLGVVSFWSCSSQHRRRGSETSCAQTWCRSVRHRIRRLLRASLHNTIYLLSLWLTTWAA